MDLTESIAPKSDQLNADDLLAGPRTFTVKGVRAGTSEQPVNIDLVEFPGRPFRPSKTVLRLLVTGWGREGDVYAGRKFTLYRKADVKWAGSEVGGIRVSHMSHLAKPIKLALTESKGNKKPYIVEPLPDDAPVSAPVPEGRIAPGRLTAIVAALESIGITTPADKLDACAQAVGRDIKSARDLTVDEGETVLAWVETQLNVPAEPEPSEPLWPDTAQPADAP